MGFQVVRGSLSLAAWEIVMLWLTQQVSQVVARRVYSEQFLEDHSLFAAMMSTNRANMLESDSKSNSDSDPLNNVEFEVFGKVQGVFFRKYTQRRARELDLVGWVQNADNGSVVGQFQGSKEAVSKMKYWLLHTGSPLSKVTKCNFRVENVVDHKDFSSFDVRQ